MSLSAIRSTFTFLFTDIESSTQLFQQYPHAYPQAVTRHHELLRKAIATRGGHLFETIGDAVFAAFPRSADAVLASVEAQRALSAEKWADVGKIRVRMGVHTAEADLREGRYFGPGVQRCEKMMSTGYGGQVLVSGATAGAVSNQLPDGIGLRDMGTHRLRGLASAERIFQVTHPDLRSEFPPLKSLTTFLSKLPARAGTVVGREVERTEIQRLLRSSRLVTITGPQGIGKTRIAIELGADLLDDFPDGVWFVALGVAGGPSRPAAEGVAETLGFDLERVRNDPAALLESLGTKQLLLILDGCETSLGECALLVERIIHHSRHVRILATSREVLAITGEVAFRLPGLSDIDSLALFLERVVPLNSGFAVPADQAALVSQLILLLDGIPAAIEDAAREIAASSLADVVARPRDERWSDAGVALLPPTEQTLLQRVSVLEGAWTIEAAEAVASGDRVRQADVLDLLASLVEKSVVLTQTMDDGSIRYRIPELLRQHGQRALAENGELEGLRLISRHLQAATTGERSA
ncbi:MAG TPA: adenylate/guanylate cyclase domain-containing protein [Candidatus Limnocylindria bacterium]|nr:adenylate/guanylate cyclase domain-containing protein [Candidatus Limnocylindria bacterium]